MTADSFFTIADMQSGYAQTRAALHAYTDEDLKRAYLDESKHGFNAVFGGNSRRFQNLIADELLARGITKIENLFSLITIRRWTY